VATSVGLEQRHALEAIADDIATFTTLFRATAGHPKGALLALGIIPPASMFVHESYKCLAKLFPSMHSLLILRYDDLIKASRHRAKLLDDDQRSINEVVGELARIAVREGERFLSPHTGFWGPLKRLIQPDLGLFTYDGHVFSSTHTMFFSFGEGCNIEAIAGLFAEDIGRYTGALMKMLAVPEFPPLPPSPGLSGQVVMKDIKHGALYKRGALGKLRLDYAAGAALVLASVNYTHYVLRGLCHAGNPTFFKLRFFVAYHAVSSLKVMQDSLRATGSLPVQAEAVFREALGSDDSRWIRRKKSLRNTLIHYLLDKQSLEKTPPMATRREVIEHLSGHLSYDEVDILLDRYLGHLSRTLEAGFRLTGDTFWYGQVTP
jgi:hypothetical protein